MPDRWLISVSAPVGGGKTSLVRGLAAALPEAAAIHFDSYEDLTERPLEDMRRWLRRGGDLDELVVPGLAEALASLREGRAVVEPATGTRIEPARYVLFETPFARRHRATGAHIDLAIWIDTPLDVALARNILEFTRRPQMYDDLGPWLRGYLESYLGTVRELLELQARLVAPDADVVLDGRLDLETNVRRARDEVLERLG